MKKCSILLLGFLMAATVLLSACGEKSKWPPGTTVLTLYHWDNGGKTETDLVEKVCREFEKSHEGYGIDVQPISSYESQMKSLIASGNIPDVFLVPDGNFGQWVSMGVMADLTEKVEASENIDLANIYPSVIDRYRYDGKLMGQGSIYCLPKDVTPYVMYYNKELFDRYGVPYPDATTPWTPEYAAEQWKKFGSYKSDGTPNTAKHVYGIASFNPEGLIWSNGGDYLSEDRTEVLVDSPEVVEVFDYLQRCAMEDYVMPMPATLAATSAKTLFLTGRAACFIEGRSVTADLRKQATFDWDIAPAPAFAVDPDCNGWSGSVGYAVYNKGAHQDIAYELCEYFTSPAGQQIMAEAGFSIPLYKDQATIDRLYEIEAGQKPANTAEFLRAAEHQRAGLWQYLPSIRWKTTLDEASSALYLKDPSKRLTAEDFLIDIKPKMKQVIREDFPYLFA